MSRRFSSLTASLPIVLRLIGALLIGVGLFTVVRAGVGAGYLAGFFPLRLRDLLVILGTVGLGGVVWSLALVVPHCERCRAPRLMWRLAAWGVLDRLLGSTCLGIGVFLACWLGARAAHDEALLGLAVLACVALFGVGVVLWGVGGGVLREAPSTTRKAVVAALQVVRRRRQPRHPRASVRHS